MRAAGFAARGRTRGAAGSAGAADSVTAVVAITFLLSHHVVGRLGRIELVRRKVHPTAMRESLRAALNAAHRRRRRDEQVLRLLAERPSSSALNSLSCCSVIDTAC